MEKIIDYVEYMEREFGARVRRNPAYSLRAFARDLGMQPSKLSEVLAGRCGLSVKFAQKIASRLRLTADESEVFVHLVEFRHGRSKLSRKQAQTRLKTLRECGKYSELSLERFKVIADWHHFAILEMTELESFESNPSWIGGRLGISTETANEAISRLLKFGLLEKSSDGRLTQTQLHLATPSGIPSRELREHHSQILAKADDALEKADIAEREFSATTLAIDVSELNEMRNQLRAFRRSFAQDFQKSTRKNRVYCLSVQLFPLDQCSKPKNKGIIP